jgi:hypothetical protein
VQTLDASLRAQVSENGLEQINAALEKKFGAYRLGRDGTEQGDDNQTQYSAVLETEKQGTQRIEFELERNLETQLWEISSLEDLQRSAER